MLWTFQLFITSGHPLFGRLYPTRSTGMLSFWLRLARSCCGMVGIASSFDGVFSASPAAKNEATSIGSFWFLMGAHLSTQSYLFWIETALVSSKKNELMSYVKHIHRLWFDIVGGAASIRIDDTSFLFHTPRPTIAQAFTRSLEKLILTSIVD